MYRQLGDFSQRRGPVGGMSVEGSASWGKCQLVDFNLSDFLGTVFILVHFYLMNVKDKHYFLNNTYLINNEFLRVKKKF